jgi:ferredoxin
MAEEPQVTVDTLVCIGAGECIRLAPKVFELNDDDQAVVVDPDAADLETLKVAEGLCPSGAVAVRKTP